MSWQIWFVFAVVAIAITLFFTGRVRLDLTAIGVILALSLFGIVSPAEAVAGFGNPLVMMIAGLFVVSEGLSRTGVAARVGLKIAGLAKASETRLILFLLPVVAVLSAFMSSTGVVALFVPVVLGMAREAGIAPARLLMPVAFASLISGMLTLIGTPPNLAVNSALIAGGREGFDFFDFTPIGGVILIFAMLYMLTIGRRLLPDGDAPAPSVRRKRLHEMAEQFGIETSLHRLRVSADSLLNGKTVQQGNLRERQRINVLSVRRGEGTLALDFEHTALQARDILLVAGAWPDLERLSGPRRDLVLLELPEEISERIWHGNQAPWAVLITLSMLVLMVTQLTSNLVAIMLAVLAGLFLLTSVFSQFISNTATTVLVAPIALSLAVDLNYDPAPLMMSVAIAASTAFATPVASPVNTLILAPGQYRFIDFLKVGVPLQMIALVVTVALVPWVFPLGAG